MRNPDRYRLHHNDARRTFHHPTEPGVSYRGKPENCPWIKSATGNRLGYVYLITNPAWPGLVKVGRAVDPKERRSTFNCSDPMRRYRIEAAVLFPDRYVAEAEMHRILHKYRVGGEWFRCNLFVVINHLQMLKERR